MRMSLWNQTKIGLVCSQATGKKSSLFLYWSKVNTLSHINPYSPNVTFLYPLKTSENRRLSDVFTGYRNVTLGEYGLSSSSRILLQAFQKIEIFDWILDWGLNVYLKIKRPLADEKIKFNYISKTLTCLLNYISRLLEPLLSNLNSV